MTLNNKIIDFPTYKPDTWCACNSWLLHPWFKCNLNENNHHYSPFTITTETRDYHQEKHCVDRRRSKRYLVKLLYSRDIEIQFYPIKIDLKVWREIKNIKSHKSLSLSLRGLTLGFSFPFTASAFTCSQLFDSRYFVSGFFNSTFHFRFNIYLIPLFAVSSVERPFTVDAIE